MVRSTRKGAPSFVILRYSDKELFSAPIYKFVILSEHSESKDLRTDFLLRSDDSAKLPRFVSLTRDDRLLGSLELLYDNLSQHAIAFSHC